MAAHAHRRHGAERAPAPRELCAAGAGGAAVQDRGRWTLRRVVARRWRRSGVASAVARGSAFAGRNGVTSMCNETAYLNRGWFKFARYGVCPLIVGSIAACPAFASHRREYRVVRRPARVARGIVQRVMQAAALLAERRAADDELGHQCEVAQLDEVVGAAEIAVILGDFLQQKIHAVLGALQALVGAHDADVVPRGAPRRGPGGGRRGRGGGGGDAARGPGG